MPPESPNAAAPILDIDGAAVALTVRRSHRARRLSLRVDPTAPPESPVELVLPRGVGLAEGLRFAHDKRSWVARRLAALPPPFPFADGALVEIHGEPVHIRHVGGTGLTRRDGPQLFVTGAADHANRRARDWIKAHAREILCTRSRQLASRLGRVVRRVRLGDPKSRWGSCAADGGLAYSWRLILAPPFVLEYVVAHEVAHLIHPNHGQQFWRLVIELCGDIETPRHWLNRYGSRLLRYG